MKQHRTMRQDPCLLQSLEIDFRGQMDFSLIPRGNMEKSTRFLPTIVTLGCKKSHVQ
jgi:hypothetical protein